MLYKLFLAVGGLSLGAAEIVQTGAGPVAGSVNKFAYFWHGIPYATPPVGQWRWRPSIPPAPWTETLNATKFSDACPQTCVGPAITCPTTFSEDCLYMNVYSPVMGPFNASANLPVMVFIHGGSFSSGAGGMEVYDASLFAKTGNVVVAAFNYRLGALGFLQLNNQLNGNFGFLDQTLALQWVRDNIQAFGGNPGRVTIFGESAGAMSVGAHLTSPLSWPLFDAAIMESNPLSLQFKDLHHNKGLNADFLALTHCADRTPSPLPCLQALHLDDIMQAQAHSEKKYTFTEPLDVALPWSPTVDGTFISEQPLVAMMAGRVRPNTPIYAGTNRDEGATFVYATTKKPLSRTIAFGLLNVLFGFRNAWKIGAQYNMTQWPADDVRPQWSDLFTDYVLECPTRAAMMGIAKKNEVWGYYYDHVVSFGKKAFGDSPCADLVCHGSELVFLFGAPLMYPQYNFTMTDDEEGMTAQMMHDWGDMAYGHGLAHIPLMGRDTSAAAPAAAVGVGAGTNPPRNSRDVKIQQRAAMAQAMNAELSRREGETASARLRYWRYATSSDEGGAGGEVFERKREICDFWDDIGYLYGYNTGGTPALQPDTA